MPEMGALDEGGIARRFWIKSKKYLFFAMYSPYFASLASGNLDSCSFLRCISQDVHFLKAFAQAYELAEECADDEEDKSAIRKLRKRVKNKLKNYDAIVHEWGFEPPADRTSLLATQKYIDFLLATASGKVEGEKFPGKIATPFERIKLAAYTLGAMAPSMLLHASITKEIQQILDPDDSSHIYKKWIDYYYSEGFEAAALQLEDMLDKLSICLTSEELDVLERLYLQAMKLKVDFFATQQIVQKTLVPLSRLQGPDDFHLTVFCDFDMTCIAVDSSAVLAEIAIIRAPKIDLNGSETQLTHMPSADLRSTWSVLSAQYVEEHDQCIESIIPAEPAEKFNYEGLSKALEQLADFEKRANSRVIQSGVLKGLNLEDIKRAGQQLIFQDGCRGFFQKIVRNENVKADVHILSYCWCGDLIRSAFSSEDLNVLQVHSNELAYEKDISTGEIVRSVECPMEKLQTLNNILNDRNTDSQQLTVYIGGSVGDLLCLLKADIGIVIGSSPSLRRLGDHFGISFVPLFSGMVKKQKELVDGVSPNWKGLPAAACL
ncbi:bifunctional TH2 protein, mitochondrial isoform X2 [Jatropha curcas]|uniref:bifunctional TH2 protein, mitochondrial isoform X2 n=1 Tax=Jatropha curcas TaxID=180498 RepID=UPI0005FACAB5|nr:bifunctional TH2 protein, mitochondrial isoform X2 [Jatropha curcas]